MQKPSEKLPEIIVFAGPNGSGKSTITKMAKIIEPYINAADIKRKCISCGIKRSNGRTWGTRGKNSLKI